MQAARSMSNMPSFTRMFSLTTGTDDGSMLDAIADDLAEPSTPGMGDANNVRLTESLRGFAPVDIDAECL